MADLPRTHEHEHVHEHEHEHESLSEAKVRRWIDYLGAVVGLLCAVHCALTPLALAFSSIAGLGFLWSEEGEGLMLWSLIGLALISAAAAAFRSRRLSVALGFVVSLSLIYVSHELLEGHHEHELSAPLLLSVLGGIGVTLCHLWSLKLRRERPCCSTGA